MSDFTIPVAFSPPDSALTARLSCKEAAADLTALFQLERETVRYEAAWLAGVPYWDAKLKIGQHLLEDAGHAESLLRRLHELKAAAAEHKQVQGVEELLKEFASAGSGDEWLHGLYGVLKPWMASQLRAYLEVSDPVMDEPSFQAIRRILAELDAQIAWFAHYSPSFSPWEQPDVSAWTNYVHALVSIARISGGRVTRPTAKTPARPPGRPDFAVFTSVRRDRTFKTVDSRIPNLVSGEGKDFAEKRFVIFYNHTQEMQYAESLGAILYETAEMPWAYHYDLARHVSDEVRHSGMGQARIEQLGYRLIDMPMMTQHYEFRSKIDALERFCLMTVVMEAASFEYKRSNVELFEANGDAISAGYETYDIRDEMMHVNLGHLWVPILLRVYHDSRSVADTVEHCRGLIAQVATEYKAYASLAKADLGAT